MSCFFRLFICFSFLFLGQSSPIRQVLIEKVDALIKSRENVLHWFDSFIEDVREQEIAVNSVQSAATATGIVSTILLFTPLAPIGIGVGVATGIAGAITSLGDFIAEKIKSGNAQAKLNADQELALDLQKTLNQLVKEIDQVATEFNVPERVALQAIYQAGKLGTLTTTSWVPYIKEGIQKAREMGTSLLKGFQVSGLKVAEFARLESGVTQLSVAVVKTSTKAFSVLGSLGGSGVTIYSWIAGSATRKTAEKARTQMRKAQNELVKLKSAFMLEEGPPPVSFEGEYTIKNVYYNEYLYAANGNFNFDSDRGWVFTWVEGALVNQAYWKLSQANYGTFSIYNTRHNNFIYAADTIFDGKWDNSSQQKRNVLSWRPGDYIRNGEWEFERHEGDYYYIRNVKHGGYLYASSDKLHETRRYVYVWNFHTRPDIGALWKVEKA